MYCGASFKHLHDLMIINMGPGPNMGPSPDSAAHRSYT